MMGAPVFYDAKGNPVSQILCGEDYSFDVPGYSQVWLEQTYNGKPSFSGPFSVPVPAYIGDCQTQIGTYISSAYELTPQGGRGTLLGTVGFRILPGGPTNVTPTDVLLAQKKGVLGLSPIVWLAIGVAAVVFMGGSGRRSGSSGGDGGDLGL
jgi:hypothetical protein